MASRRLQPNMRSAWRFQSVIWPDSFISIMASKDESRTLRRRLASSDRFSPTRRPRPKDLSWKESFMRRVESSCFTVFLSVSEALKIRGGVSTNVGISDLGRIFEQLLSV